MRSLIIQNKLFPTIIESNRGVMNMFASKKATTEQAHDLIEARKIGQEYYKDYITHHIIQSPSVKAPLRKKRLLTMAPAKALDFPSSNSYQYASKSSPVLPL